MSVHLTHHTPGCAAILFGATGRRLWYRCDPVTHHVMVTDDHGRTVRVFGGFGHGAGRLDTPLDIAFVQPQFAGELLPYDCADAVWVAVADYGNRRVQVFELDGSVVGQVAIDARAGAPTALRWLSPELEVEGVDGVRCRMHLGGALLAGLAASGDRDSGWTASTDEARH